MTRPPRSRTTIRDERVLAPRRGYQDAMPEEGSARVAELTGRNVVAMMSANHLSPDLGAEIFVPALSPWRPGVGDARNLGRLTGRGAPRTRLRSFDRVDR